MVQQFSECALTTKFVSLVLCLLLAISSIVAHVCTRQDSLLLLKGNTCPSFTHLLNVKRPLYIFYDVNPSEGFNLRRDVYIRLAVFVREISEKPEYRDIRLVLPPFRRLFHWRSNHIQQENLLWSHFFDLDSLKSFAPVLDFDEFLEEAETFSAGEPISFDCVYQLKHFEDMFENGVFRDKFEFQNCKKSDHHRRFYFQQRDLAEKKFTCLKFQGSAHMLEKVLRKENKQSPHWPKLYLFLNAETVLHDHWGSYEFWEARRSMRFSRALVQIASDYRRVNFESTNEADLVQRPFKWEDEMPYRGARGGDYLCAHIRRADFVNGREKTTPTLKSAAGQIRAKLQELSLSKVFISSDCTQFEYKNLKAYLPRVKLFRYSPESLEQKQLVKDGGVAIIDQIICSHARYFIGTFESTFTYRIYEEREIMGFPKNATFNTFCKSETGENCSKNSVWSIVY